MSKIVTLNVLLSFVAGALYSVYAVQARVSGQHLLAWVTLQSNRQSPFEACVQTSIMYPFHDQHTLQ